MPRRSFRYLAAGVRVHAPLWRRSPAGGTRAAVLVLVPDEDEDDVPRGVQLQPDDGVHGTPRHPRVYLLLHAAFGERLPASTTYRRAAFELRPRTLAMPPPMARGGRRRRPRSGASRCTTARPRAGPSSPTRT